MRSHPWISDHGWGVVIKLTQVRSEVFRGLAGGPGLTQTLLRLVLVYSSILIIEILRLLECGLDVWDYSDLLYSDTFDIVSPIKAGGNIILYC